MADTTYVTLGQFKQYIPISDVIDDFILQESLNAAAMIIDAYTDRSFEDTGATLTARTFMPTEQGTLVVDDFSTTTGLIIKTDDDGDGVYETTWAAGDYQLEPVTRRYSGIGAYPYTTIRGITRWFVPNVYGRAVVQVTARWGWAEVPAPVRVVTLELAKDIFKAKDSVSGVVGFGDFGAIRVNQSPALRKLSAFRRNLGIV